MLKPIKNRIKSLQQEQFENAPVWMMGKALASQYSFQETGVEVLYRRVFQWLGSYYNVKKAINTPLVWLAIRKIAEREFIQQRKLMHKNFGLTEISFNTLVEALQVDNDSRLYEEIFLQHFEECLLFLKKQYRISHHDAYDATMETLLEFGKRLREGKIKYGNLRFLFTQMAGQIYFRRIKKDPPTEELYKIEIEDEPETIDERTFNILDKAWNKLGKQCRELLKQNFYKGMNLREVADQFGQPATAIRKQKQRCVEKLRGLFIQYY